MDWKINVRAIKRKIAVVLAVLLFFSVIPEESLITLANPAVAGEEVSTETVTDGNGESVTEGDGLSATDGYSESEKGSQNFGGMMFSTGPDYGVNPAADLAQLEFTEEVVTLFYAGIGAQNEGVFEYNDGITAANRYYSENTGIVQVDNSGNLTPIAPGTATITAEYVEEVDGVETTLASGTFRVEVQKAITTLQWDLSLIDLTEWEWNNALTVNAASDSDGQITYSATYKEPSNYTVTVNGNVITATGPGTIVITASQAEGNLYQAPAPITKEITLTGDVSKGTTTLQWDAGVDALTEWEWNTALTVNATSDSDGQITYSAAYKEPSNYTVTVNGNVITATGPGTIVITASQAEGNLYQAPAPITKEITLTGDVSKGTTTLQWDAGVDALTEWEWNTALTVNATSDSDGQITYSAAYKEPSNYTVTVEGNVITATGPGTIVITASQGESDLYQAPAPITKEITLIKGTTTLQWDLSLIDLTEWRWNTALTVNAASASNGQITYSAAYKEPSNYTVTVEGNVITATGPGTIVITASQGESDLYQAPAPITKEITLIKGTTTLQWDLSLIDLTEWEWNAALTINAASDSEGQITYSAYYTDPSNGHTVNVNRNEITANGPGTIVITASQAESDLYHAPAPITKEITLIKAKVYVDDLVLDYVENGVYTPELKGNFLGEYNLQYPEGSCVSWNDAHSFKINKAGQACLELHYWWNGSENNYYEVDKYFWVTINPIENPAELKFPSEVPNYFELEYGKSIDTYVSDATDVKYRSSNGEIVEVDENSGKITAKQVSDEVVTITAYLPATDIYKEKSISYTVKVVIAQPMVSFSKGNEITTTYDVNNNVITNVLKINGEEKTDVSYSVYEEKNINGVDADIVDIDENGTVTIKGVGTAIIQADYATDGNYAGASAKYTLKVNKGEQRVWFDPSNYVVQSGESFSCPPVCIGNNISSNYATEKRYYSKCFNDCGTCNASGYCLDNCEECNVIERHDDFSTTGRFDLTNNAGKVQIVIFVPGDDNYEAKEAWYDLTVLEPQGPAEGNASDYFDVLGDTHNGWYTGEVSIKAKNDYLVSETYVDPDWVEQLNDFINVEGINISKKFYMRKGSNQIFAQTVSVNRDVTPPAAGITLLVREYETKYHPWGETYLVQRIENSMTDWSNTQYIRKTSAETDTLKVYARWEGQDLVSQLDTVQYYIDYDTIRVKSVEELEAENLQWQWSWVGNEIEIDSTRKFVAYVKIKDRAGHVSYASTSGIISDWHQPDIQYQFGKQSVNGFYDEDVLIDLIISDTDNQAISSGIKKVEYALTWIDEEGVEHNIDLPEEQKVLYADSAAYPSDDTITSWSTAPNGKTIVVPVATTNYSEIRCYATVWDFANNSKTVEIPFSVCITDSVLDVEFTDDILPAYTDELNVPYYTQDRTIEIRVTGKKQVFNKDGLSLTITKEDSKSSTQQIIVLNDESMWTGVDGTNQDNYVYKTTYVFDEPARYTCSVGYVDKLNKVTTYNLDRFIIDTEGPDITITAKGGMTKNSDDSEITYGRIYSWNKESYPDTNDKYDFKSSSNTPVLVSAECVDSIAAVSSIQYYIVYGNYGVIDPTTQIADSAWTEYTDPLLVGQVEEDGILKTKDIQFMVYFKIKDSLGNVSYCNTNAIIVDSTPVEIEAHFDPAQNENGFINGQNIILVTATVKEPIVAGSNTNGPYSGVAKVKSYMLLFGNYPFGEKDNYVYNGSYKDSDLASTWISPNEGDNAICIDSRAIDQNYVQLCIEAEDNAGNITRKIYPLKIDSLPPEMVMYADNNSPVGSYNQYNHPSLDINSRGYYNAPRGFQFRIKESEDGFNGKKALETILGAIEIKKEDNTLVDVYDVAWLKEHVNNFVEWDPVYDEKMGWSSFDNNPEVEDPNDIVHEIIIWFTEEADYTIDRNKILYRDEAGLMCKQMYIGQNLVNPFYFTIDKTAPELKVEFKKSNQEVEEFTTLSDGSTFEMLAGDATIRLKEHSDAISPYSVYYYEANTSVPLSVEELNALESDVWKAYTKEITSTKNKYSITYFKAVDYAGNVKYVNTNVYIVDTLPAEAAVVLEATAADHEGVPLYNKDVKATINVTDPDDYSGIAKVEYWVTSDNKITQSETFALAPVLTEGATIKQEMLTKQFTKDVTIYAALNNSCNVVLHVKVTDNSGNEKEESKKLDIDMNKPIIQVTYDNNDCKKVAEGKEYYNQKRVANVVVTERTGHFDGNKAKDGIVITAKDIEGFDDNAIISAWKTVEDPSNVDNATHTAQITYAADGNYSFAMSYTDFAENTNVVDGNVKGLASPYEFVVDTNCPTGTVAIGNLGEWKELITNLTFGLTTRVTVDVRGTADDKTSPLEQILYYKTANTKALTVTELDAIVDWTPFTQFEVSPIDQFTIYMKLVDYAGNVTYISSDGVILDNMAPKINIGVPGTSSGVYNSDVKVSVNVQEPNPGYSGIKEIRYEVTNLGAETQSAILYTFDGNTSSLEALAMEKTVDFVVRSDLNNSNEVAIKVTAIDNAGNLDSKTEVIKIDVTKPIIEVSYNNNIGDNTFGDKIYFKDNRVATISVKERNFSSDMVSINVANEHGVLPTISGWQLASAPTGNGDNTVYVATVSYVADGDYTFDVSCTDIVGNPNDGVNYGSSLAPNVFTIDKTLPVIEVLYDNDNVQNQSYYKESRVATVRIREHNFETSRIVLNMSAVNDGKSVAIPNVNGWSHNGDVHTATIRYEADALYSFDIDYVDMAGNQAADRVPQSFFIDTTEPKVELVGIVDQSANNTEGNIGFVITATDDNFEQFTPEVEITYMDGGKIVTKKITEEIGEIATITKGKTYTVTNLKVDGIYKVLCTVVDKAGNGYTMVSVQGQNGEMRDVEKTSKDALATFSVNRNGSTYDMNAYTKKVVQDYYIKYVGEDLVIYEINADKLTDYKVTLNGKELEKNKDYTVKTETTQGNWMKYSYIINKSVFEKEGEYNVVVSSIDKAGNQTFNDVKGLSVAFVVDRTAPVVTISGMTANGRYQIDRQIVKLTPKDDGGALKAIYAYLVDNEGRRLKELLSLSGEELEKALSEGNGDLFFEIGEGLYQNVQIICEDYAMGEDSTNVYNSTFNNVSVSSSAVKILWANKPLRYGIFIGVFAVAGGFFLLLFLRRKRKNK